jgi:DNA-binding transcriptional LysR family regulator
MLPSASATASTLGPTRVSRLEDRLGVRLLHWTTRRVSVTDAGLALYARAARIVTASDEAVQGARGEPRGLLRISAPVTSPSCTSSPPLQELLAKYPAVRVEPVTSDRIVDVIAEGSTWRSGSRS